MPRASKSQYGGCPSLKSRGNQEYRCSTGHPYRKICQKELTPIVVEEEEFSPPTNDAEPENAPLDVSQPTFRLSTCVLLGLERVCNDFGQFRLGGFSVRRYLAQTWQRAKPSQARAVVIAAHQIGIYPPK